MTGRASNPAQAGALRDRPTDAALHSAESQTLAIVYALMTVRGAMFQQEARGESLSPLAVGRLSQAAAALEPVRAALRGLPGFGL